MQTAKKNMAFKLGSGVTGLALLLVIIAAITLTFANLRMRVDLTEQHLFSLSSGTREILGKLPSDVTLKFYFSRSSQDVPIELKTYAQHVQDLLQEYRLAGHGHVYLETYDPQPDSEAEEWAERQGLEAQTISPLGAPMYFGLVASCGSQETSIPALSPNEDAKLEYMITRLITRVVYPKKPVLGVLSSLPVLGMPQEAMMMMRQPAPQGWMAFNILKEDYDVRQLPVDLERVDPEIGTLIVVHPKNLTDQTLYAIDQFVLRGGHLIACVDPLCAADSGDEGNPMMRMMGGGPSTLGKLFDAWGVGFDTTKVIADLRAVTRLRGQKQIMESPTFLSISKKGINREDILMGQVEQIMLPYAGELVDKTKGKLTFTPLITSSSDASCPVDAMGAQFASVTSIRAQFKPDHIAHVLAARIQGTFKSAFPTGQPGSTNSSPNHLLSGDSVVLVFADSDFLADRNCVSMERSMLGGVTYAPINDNIALFDNGVEQLSGRKELIGIRSRGSFNRPFEVVEELEYRAMRTWQDKEEELSNELEKTRQKLAEIQQQKKGSQKLLISKEQQDAIEHFREQETSINRELKNVRKSLRKDIDALGFWVKTINIATVPILVVAFGCIRSALRRKRR